MHGAVTGRCGDCLHPIDEHTVITDVSTDATGTCIHWVRVCNALVNGHVCACRTAPKARSQRFDSHGQELEC